MKRWAGDSRAQARVGAALVCAVFVVLAVLYAVNVRLGGGPDETSHLIYIRTLALERAMPEIAAESVHSLESRATHEGHQPPLYYAVMAVPYGVLDALGVPVETIWRILRILGIVFGVAWILSVRRLGNLVFGNESAGLAVAAFVGLIPTAAFMAGMVDNDAMISMWFGWALVYIVQFLKAGSLSRRSAVALGAIMGAAILTKAQGIILVPVFLLAAMIVWLSGKRHDARSIVSVIACVLLAAFAAGGWWLVRSQVVHGAIQPESLSAPLLHKGLADALADIPAFWEATCTLVYGTWGYFWTPFWILAPFVHNRTYVDCVTVLTLVPIAIFAIRALLVRGLDMRVYGVLIITAALVVGAWLRHVLFVDAGANLQGRLFLPIAPVVAVVGLAGLEPLMRRRWGMIGISVIVYGGLLAANVVVFRYLEAYYALGYG